MFVSRSDVSWRDSIHRDSCVTGANAIASSVDGSGALSALLRTTRPRVGGVGRGERQLPRAGAALQIRRDRLTPAVGRLLPLGLRHRHLGQLLGLGERGGGDGGARTGRGARWRATP